MSLDRLPNARVHREGGAEVAPPSRPVGEHLRGTFAPLAAHGRNALQVVVGLWPLTVIMVVMAALIWSAGTPH
jgi:hypothetical protein